MFMTDAKPACAIESSARSAGPYFWTAASIRFASSVPLSSESNGCAK